LKDRKNTASVFEEKDMRKRFNALISVLLVFSMLLPFTSANGATDDANPVAAIVADSSAKSSYVFQPKVCSVFMEEVFGKTMCEAWGNLVDAVLAGEDTFACSDQHTYDWVMGQFPKHCLPILPELIDYAYDRSHSVKNGVASFTWCVSPEEASARIAEFGEQIEEILNTALRDDDTDFEKAVALYDYFYQNYQYDWETYEESREKYVETTPMHLFRTGRGICSEIAPAYSYLLMQAGVEATTMMGPDHEWSYVRISGHEYHIDPTYVLDSEESFAFFMMTDEQRALTGFPRDDMFITSNYAKDHPHPAYKADDSTFSVLWDYQFEGLLREENKLRCWQYSEGWEKAYLDFNYD